MSCRMWSTVLWHTPTSAANSCAVHQRSTSSREARSCIVWLSTWGCPERHPCLHGTLLPIVPLCNMAMLYCHMLQAVPENSLVHYDFVQLQFHPGALFQFHKHVVRALALSSCTSRHRTMQLNHIQLSPLAALPRLTVRYQLQKTYGHPDSRPLHDSSVAITFYPTLVLSVILEA
jgi:hypothetical protein